MESAASSSSSPNPTLKAVSKALLSFPATASAQNKERQQWGMDNLKWKWTINTRTGHQTLKMLKPSISQNSSYLRLGCFLFSTGEILIGHVYSFWTLNCTVSTFEKMCYTYITAQCPTMKIFLEQVQMLTNCAHKSKQRSYFQYKM